MFLPYSTDARITYRPVGTIGLVLANLLVCLALPAEELLREGTPWRLAYGEGIFPIQWVASRFAEVDPLRLFTNAVFLAAFSLVVEGKLGLWVFAPTYMLALMGQGFLEQTSMRDYTGPPAGSFGAEAGVYGLMAMAVLWAPVDRVVVGWWCGVFGSTRIPIVHVALAFVATDLGLSLLDKQPAPHVGLQAIGAVIGALLGLPLLQSGLAEGRGRDVISRYARRNPADFKTKLRAFEQTKRDAETVAKRKARAFEETRRDFDHRLACRDAGAALELYEKMRSLDPEWRFDGERLKQLSDCLQSEGRWVDVAPILAERITLDEDDRDLLRINLAQICVKKLARPGRAIRLLQHVDYSAITTGQRNYAHELIDRARQAIQKAGIEVADDGW